MYLQIIFRVCLLKFCVLVSYLQITATFHDSNFEKMYAFFGVIVFLFFSLSKSGCVKFWTFRMSGFAERSTGDCNMSDLINWLSHKNFKHLFLLCLFLEKDIEEKLV